MALLSANSWVTRADRPDLLMLFHWSVCRPEHPIIGLTNINTLLMVLMVAQKQLTATPRQSADPKRYPAAAAVEWPACVRLPCHERID